MKFSFCSAIAAGLLSAGVALGQATGTIHNGPFPDDLNGSNFTYPYPVHTFNFVSQFQNLEMAFMDVKPTCKANGETIVLLHGNYFCSVTWEATIKVLIAKGYRVVAIDHVGYCKSTKPDNYQFTLRQLVWNTRGLLNTLGLGNVTVMGHSFGGSVTTMFGLMYPETIDKLILVDPIGLEDYSAEGVPYVSIDSNDASEALSNFSSVKAYEEHYYYVDKWEPAYNVWVTMFVNILFGSQRQNFLLCQARVVDLVLTNPIAQYFKDLTTHTLLMIGDKDKTAIGSQWAPPAVAAKLGQFDVLGPERCSEIADCTLVQFPNLGHAPQISNPTAFHEKLLAWLEM